MTLYKVFYDVLADLADLFDAENRMGGHEAAQELRKIHDKCHTPLLPANQALPGVVQSALSLNPHPICEKISKITSLIDWHHSGLENGMITAEIAKRIATTELIGPDGMVYNDTVRVGLFVQSAGLDYVTRRHAAEETFIMLGGSGYWQADDSPKTLCKSGDMIHHPSDTPHISITKKQPFIAAWRWTGDIGYDKYTLTG
ncbi:hypothetical protein F9L33_13500 [Amylibacter sp. SFDW26]|uniref:dimethylsulfonioproprionate lyase family protein n=1 Tax=Amylibacter sp. SFDW26 TaxID=2652722 RepID=UPI0012620A5D|nr:dimethylsulfonioproprionate lyase family protein [Amylibacter sp. SFDW26]KAB7610317.1 hypothetical protein F9L33_13500 [Amylibacter sp. SFDW26]